MTVEPTRERLGLRALVRHGRGAVWRYTGLALMLFLIQLALAGGAAWVASQILNGAFGTSLVFDDAVDGDLVALVVSFRHAPQAMLATLWVCVAAIFAYLAVSWFTTGGWIAVLREQPTDRRGVARCFGAGGATTFFAYARLAALSALPYTVLLLAASGGLALVGPAALAAATPTGAFLRVLAGLAPACVLAWVIFTIVDYARVELSTHPGLGATAALLRATRIVFASPTPLVHVAAYYAFFLLVSVGYVLLTSNHAMLGTTGAISLLVVRQGLAILRFTAKLGLIAGQVELAQAAQGKRGSGTTTTVA